MIPLADAEHRIRDALAPLPVEWLPVEAAFGRVLAADLAAGRDHPAGAVSAMDGYAVRAADLTDPAGLRLAGSAAAGAPQPAPLAAGAAMRIFTGALLPAGADAILIQENAAVAGERVFCTVDPPAAGRFVRPQGLDFRAGQVLLAAGTALGARQTGLAAAMGYGHVAVHRRPRVGVAGTGDELVRPGAPMAAHHLANSNTLTIAGCVRAFGGEPVDLGIVRDDPSALRRLIEDAQGLDLLVTSGGASVGDHDLVAAVLGEAGFELDFWKIAMRPGKPLLFGRLGAVPVLGLPGNPVSTAVCCLVFLRAALLRLGGRPFVPLPTVEASLAAALAANDERHDFVRAAGLDDADGKLVLRPADRQDSSMLATLAAADYLISRPPHDAPRPVGATVTAIALGVIAGF